MTESTENPFRHISLTSPGPQIVLAGNQPKEIEEVVFNASLLVDSAQLFFQGIFPRQFPYCCDSGDYLPWYDEYEGRPDAVRCAIYSATTRLLWGRTPTERGPQIAESYHLHVVGDENAVQLLAIEALLAIDGLIDSIESGALTAALAWQHAALANICEATVRATEVLDTSNHAQPLALGNEAPGRAATPDLRGPCEL
jgi:hypothetical protein